MEKDNHIKQICLEEMKELLYKWEDKIPQQIISNVGEYKARCAWFQVIYGYMSLAEKKGLLNEEIIKEYDCFKNYMEHLSGLKTIRRTSKEDIQRGNRLLENAIKCLEETV